MPQLQWRLQRRRLLLQRRHRLHLEPLQEQAVLQHRLLVRQQQMLASVTLIRALGGGWAERRDASGTAWVMPAKQVPGG